MARIRTIKPEFWKHEDLSGVSESAHMLAASLLNYADDEGYFNANEKLIHAECRPLRDTSEIISGLILELSRIGYLRIGTDPETGRRYGHIIKFLEHQRVDKPKPSKIAGLRIVWDGSKNDPGTIPEPSKQEGKGREGKGREGKGTGKGRELAPVNGAGPKPPGDDAPAFQWLSWDFHITRKELMGDQHFNPWDPKYLAQCKTIVEKKAGGDYGEAQRRAQNLCAWAQFDPSFYQITPGDLLSKWDKLHTPPSSGKNYDALREMAFNTERAGILRRIAEGAG